VDPGTAGDQTSQSPRPRYWEVESGRADGEHHDWERHLWLPSALAGLLGRASLLALLIGAIAAGVIGACFSEVASYFTVAGGPYLYTRVAYGRFVGLQVGWMYWLVRLTARRPGEFVRGLFWGSSGHGQ